jgi:hypothetical protein
LITFLLHFPNRPESLEDVASHQFLTQERIIPLMNYSRERAD